MEKLYNGQRCFSKIGHFFLFLFSVHLIQICVLVCLLPSQLEGAISQIDEDLLNNDDVLADFSVLCMLRVHFVRRCARSLCSEMPRSTPGCNNPSLTYNRLFAKICDFFANFANPPPNFVGVGRKNTKSVSMDSLHRGESSGTLTRAKTARKSYFWYPQTHPGFSKLSGFTFSTPPKTAP